MREMEYRTCKRGHLLTEDNVTSNRSCIKCKIETTRIWRENNRERELKYREENKDRKTQTNKNWYEENKERCLSNKKTWKENNAKLIAEKDKEWRENNKEKDAQRKRIWHEVNKEHRLKYRKENSERIAKNKRRWKEDNKDKVTDSHHRRRAAKRNVESEIIKIKLVYERDSWICQICGDAVNPNLKHPNQFSASLDHKIPLSKGGKHTFENVRLTHLICNITKSNTIYKEHSL